MSTLSRVGRGLLVLNGVIDVALGLGELALQAGLISNTFARVFFADLLPSASDVSFRLLAWSVAFVGIPRIAAGAAGFTKRGSSVALDYAAAASYLGELVMVGLEALVFNST
jgi:hypothetical protein